MRFAAVAGLFFAVCLTAGCSVGGSDRGDGVVVRIITPPPTPRDAPPGVSPTPLPRPELVLSAERIWQAGAVLVSVTGGLKSGAVTFIGREYTLTQGDRSMFAFVGADADDPPGTQPLKVDFVLKNGSKGSLSAVIEVLKTTWEVETLILTPQLQLLIDPAIANAETAQLRQVYSLRTPEKLWSGVGWLQPAQGTLTARYGQQRAYNSGPASGHHSGTDIGAPEGTPVLATNSGRVAMARQLRQRGNIVVIDHGGGLLSGYAHMSSFAVAEGQMVQQGDIVGYVGSTGLSTGAHLHWEMSAGGVLVDAFRFVDGTNGF